MFKGITNEPLDNEPLDMEEIKRVEKLAVAFS